MRPLFKTKDQTIVAIATPLGEGGLGVIRLSGPQAFSIADKIFHFSQKLSEVPSHTLHHGWISKGPDMVDEVVASVFQAPKSYTGENVVEFSCHGSPTVLKEIVEYCVASGARLAEPGEFTQRAYLNGKLDLAQAEAVADLIHSQSSRAARAASRQLQGSLSSRIKAIRKTLVDLVAHIEANLDFVEEDIPGLARDDMKSKLEKIQQALGALLSTSVKGRQVRQGVRVALMGKPNVGKSSLFNALLAQDRAIVTDMPGTTRDTLEERLEWSGYPIVLVDTAGLRDAQDQVEKIGTDRARQAHDAADVLLFVADGSAPLNGQDKDFVKSLKGRKAVGVLNKSDQGLKTTNKDLETLGLSAVVSASAKTGAGLSDIKNKVVSLIDSSSPETEDAPLISHWRHIESLEAAGRALQKAHDEISSRASEEQIAADLREGLEALGAITGESVSDEVLTSIFRQFCVGK